MHTSSEECGTGDSRRTICLGRPRNFPRLEYPLCPEHHHRALRRDDDHHRQRHYRAVADRLAAQALPPASAPADPRLHRVRTAVRPRLGLLAKLFNKFMIPFGKLVFRPWKKSAAPATAEPQTKS